MKNLNFLFYYNVLEQSENDPLTELLDSLSKDTLLENSNVNKKSSMGRETKGGASTPPNKSHPPSTPSKKTSTDRKRKPAEDKLEKGKSDAAAASGKKKAKTKSDYARKVGISLSFI